MDFDFDAWKQLFQDDPQEAERRRKEATITRVPSDLQGRLWRLQWRIDMERARYKASPLGACIALNRMLMERVSGEGGLEDHLNVVRKLLEGKADTIDADANYPRNVMVLDFPKK